MAIADGSGQQRYSADLPRCGRDHVSILAVLCRSRYEGHRRPLLLQFGITVSVAVAVSMLVSFTLTPMLSSRFLRADHGKPGAVSRGIDYVLTGMDNFYGRVVTWALNHRALTMLVAMVALAASFVMVSRVKSEFIPPEDRAQFNVNVEMPTGTSLDATSKVTEAVAETSASRCRACATLPDTRCRGQRQKTSAKFKWCTPEQRGYPIRLCRGCGSASAKAPSPDHGAPIALRWRRLRATLQFYVRGSDMDDSWEQCAQGRAVLR